jgi:hypothetical protein
MRLYDGCVEGALTSTRTDVTDIDVLTKSFAQVEHDFGRIDNWWVKHALESEPADRTVWLLLVSYATSLSSTTNGMNVNDS